MTIAAEENLEILENEAHPVLHPMMSSIFEDNYKEGSGFHHVLP